MNLRRTPPHPGAQTESVCLGRIRRPAETRQGCARIRDQMAMASGRHVVPHEKLRVVPPSLGELTPSLLDPGEPE